VNIHRRSLFALLAAASLLPPNSDAVAAPERPDPKTFEPGDMIWPKVPGAIVPYAAPNSPRPMAPREEEGIYSRERWEQEKEDFLRKEPAGELSPDQIEAIKKLSFEEFTSRYYGNVEPDTTMSGSIVYVGHVGILDVDNRGNIEVVEAVMESEKRVRVYPYDRWLADRPRDDVWHGRLRDRSASDRHQMVGEARKYLGRPYEFFNFNLNDDSGFYCSKLVWLAVYRSMHFPVDDDPNPRRHFWFSPKQLLNAPHVQKLFVPGNYGSK
jgi:hypothetical protein